MTYDTGFFPGGKTSREAFDSDVVRRELQVVADDLHCTAVRITGGDPERLSLAAGHAAESGLEVWFSPFPCEMTPDQMLPYLPTAPSGLWTCATRGPGSCWSPGAS